MHIQLDDQETGASCTLCVDRRTLTCTVLRGEESLLPQALAIAESMKVGVVRLVIHPNALEDLEKQGWKDTGFIVIERRMNGNVLKGAPHGKTPESLVR